MSEWRPIATAPCDDTVALVYFNDGVTGRYGVEVIDLDHDSDPEWWELRGATHWMPLPEPPRD